MAHVQHHVANGCPHSNSLLAALSKTGVGKILNREIAVFPIGGFYPALQVWIVSCIHTVDHNRDVSLTSDAARVERVLLKLARHNIRNWALTGGLAFDIHSRMLNVDCPERALNDLDFVTGEFAYIPGTLSQDFLFRHIHPFAPPGKTMLQLIDPDAALRIDVFRSCGETMRRTVEVDTMQLVSLEDLVARAARLLLNLAAGVPVSSKHARDYLRFVNLAAAATMEAAWQDHRKASQPTTFQETKTALEDLIPASTVLLITPKYSQDPNQLCPNCAPNGPFQLADPNFVLSLLGYC